MQNNFTLTVNGREWNIQSDPQRPLLEVLREDLRLTGTKYGCGEGRCGACAVLVGGRVAFSCTTPVSRMDKQEIVTIEGLAAGDKLHPVQEAFLAEGALQCGYCTTGMIMAAVSLLNTTPQPSDADIVQGMSGHLCRCCTYPRILKAVKRAAQQLAGR